MAPIPSWSVARSGTSSATCAPIRSLDVADHRAGVGVRWDVDLDAEVDVVDVDEALAERPRHRPVELDDDRLRRADGRVHRLDARPERAEPVGVGRRRVDEHDIERQGAALEQARDVGQEDRDVVGAALVDRRAGVRPDEQGAMPEVAGHLGRQVRPRALRVEVDDADVAQLLGAIDQRLEQDRRRRGRAVQVDALTGLDDAGRVGRRDEPHRHSLRGDHIWVSTTTRSLRNATSGPPPGDLRT